MKNGIRTIALFKSTSGKYSDYSDYIFRVNNIKYECSTTYNYMQDESFPFKEKPILVAYDPSDPDRNIALMNEEFTYGGYKIRYRLNNPKESGRAYMEFSKIEN